MSYKYKTPNSVLGDGRSATKFEKKFGGLLVCKPVKEELCQVHYLTGGQLIEKQRLLKKRNSFLITKLENCQTQKSPTSNTIKLKNCQIGFKIILNTK